MALGTWADTAAFFSEADPLGVIGSTILDKLNVSPDYYQFKHHYILHTLDSQILLQILTAIGGRMTIKLTTAWYIPSAPSRFSSAPRVEENTYSVITIVSKS